MDAEKYNISLCKSLERLRLRADLTQQQVADLIQVSRKTYVDYEKNLRPVPSNKLTMLAVYYKVSFDYLFSYKENDD